MAKQSTTMPFIGMGGTGNKARRRATLTETHWGAQGRRICFASTLSEIQVQGTRRFSGVRLLRIRC